MSTGDGLKEIKDLLTELSKKIDGINGLIEERLIRSDESLLSDEKKNVKKCNDLNRNRKR